MKIIIVFVNKVMIKSIEYKTKREAISNYRHFKKHGMIDPNTGLIIKDAVFELL